MTDEPENLNCLDNLIESNGGLPDPSPITPSSAPKIVRVHFRCLEYYLKKYINEADAVVGCLAWFSSNEVIEEMSRLRAVSVIVQKEDFLRPDTGGTGRNGYRPYLRKLYRTLPSTFSMRTHAYTFRHTDLCYYGGSGPQRIEAVRCLGVRKSADDFAVPRMHHKFLVFMRQSPWQNDKHALEPYAVWTGSLNPTKNGRMSLENAVYIEQLAEAETDHATIPIAYLKEWSNLMVHSESLDWSSVYVAPEWQLGTT